MVITPAEPTGPKCQLARITSPTTILPNAPAMSSATPVRSYVAAENRRQAVERMIKPHPQLSRLYSEGPAKDGKGGWVNMIRDQHGQAYRLLFYLDRIRLAATCGDKEPYEVIFGEIDPNSEVPNFPRALYTTTGATNLMGDGIPEDPFVDLLALGQFEIEPFTLERDVETKHLWQKGLVYLCIYDKEGEGLRILDLREYLMLYLVSKRNEIQVHSEEVVQVGDTTLVQPFFLVLKPKTDRTCLL